MELLIVLLAVVGLAVFWWARRSASARPPSRAAIPVRRAAAPAVPPVARPVTVPAEPGGPIPAIAAILEAGARSELDEAVLPELLQDFTLLTVDDLEPQRRNELVGQLSTVALPPRSAQQLMSPDFLADADTRKFTELVTHEPLLSGKVIGRVNSAFYGLSSPIVSVSHAVTYLGLNAVRNMALQFTLEQAFASDDPELQAFHARLFDAGTIAAELCALLGPKLGVRDVGAASTQTVLTFLGDFAMPSLLPPRVAIDQWPLGLLDRTANEQFTLGTNAAVIGALLMAEWGLPPAISDDVRDINRLLVTPAEGEMTPRKTRLALSYTCARIAEGIALGRIRDAGQIDPTNDAQVEFFHLRSYLAIPPLVRLPNLLAETGVRLAIARMIAASQRSREEAAS